nr:EOG090X06K9 [Artemia franciscana]
MRLIKEQQARQEYERPCRKIENMRRNVIISLVFLCICVWMISSYLVWNENEKLVGNTLVGEDVFLEKGESTLQDVVLPVLLFSCNRPSVQRAIDLLLKYRPDKEKHPIIVSQDCWHAKTAEVLQRYKDEIIYIKHPDLSDVQVPMSGKGFEGYYKISRHYKFGLSYIFNEEKYKAVIVVEDDLEVSPDFFSYFSSTYPILVEDPILWCVSAWNDNGKPGLIDETNQDALYRSDFFPGLGWMMTQAIWNELDSKWPNTFWDDWMRLPNQRKERACLRPEISRTKTFGKVGVSNGLFFEDYLKHIKLNEKAVAFGSLDLSYLLKETYDRDFQDKVDSAPVVAPEHLRANKYSKNKISLRLLYRSKADFIRIARLFELMRDFKSGVPRTAYNGVVTFHYNGVRVYLAPSDNFLGYDPSWLSVQYYQLMTSEKFQNYLSFG